MELFMTSIIQPKVKTQNGELIGCFTGDIYVFKGIPYAEPPVGDLRWMPPQHPKSWTGKRPALSSGPIAPQNESHFKKNSQFVIKEPQSEDCLYLNLWSPALDDQKRPVLVWFHGGAFALGSGSQADFSGHLLAKRGNVIVVTINYRLGLLGFLNLNEVTSGKIPATGNEGLLDQIAALQWVKDNISVFGGDPANVTLFGESAGAMCIACLMASPRARGLFHKVISQSGAANRAKPLDEAVKDAQLFLDALGLKNPNARDLLSLTEKQLLAVQRQLESQVQAMTVTTPVIDGYILSGAPLKVIQSGSAADIPLLIGTNQDEWRLFNPNTPNFQNMDYSRLVNRCSKLVPSSYIDKLIESYRSAREKQNLSVTPAELFMAIKSDHDFRIPSIKLAEAQSKHTQNVFSYLFDWQSPDIAFGSCHSLEIGFVFGTFNNNPDFYGSGPLAEKLSAVIQDTWSAFALTGNPGCNSLGTWPVYNTSRYTWILGKHLHLVEAPFDEERRVWESIPENYTRL
jgi:para-nitrobenzyl esterase